MKPATKLIARKLRREAQKQRRIANECEKEAAQLLQVASILEQNGRRRLSAAARKRISQAQKARWARSRKKPAVSIRKVA